MKIRVLGCSGGIGDGRHTTSFLLNDDTLVDCGTGVTSLGHEELRRIQHVFLTHSHLDHICALPLLLDSVAGQRQQALTLHALPEVLEILQTHLFNWRLWPDFTCIPSPEAPYLRYASLELGRAVPVQGGEIIPIPANHVVPAVGFLLRGGSGSLLFSGDTAHHEALWEIAAQTPDLGHVVVECSFPDALAQVAEAAKHYCPRTLAPILRQLPNPPQVWITHLKPAGEADIMGELAQQGATRAQPLQQGQIIEL